MIWVPVIYTELETMPHFYLKLPGNLKTNDDKISSEIDNELRVFLSSPQSPLHLTPSV
jgi:hypothetical protein